MKLSSTCLVALVLMSSSLVWAGFPDPNLADQVWDDAQAFPEREESPVARVARLAMPSVVTIVTQSRTVQSSSRPVADPFLGEVLGNIDEPPAKEPGEGIGTGFVVHPSGYIVTAAHVVKDAVSITVRFTDADGGIREFIPRVIGLDESEEFDVALLKIDVSQPLSALRLGSSRSVEVGDWVVSIGSPFGLPNTVTLGTVANKAQVVSPGGAAPACEFMQLDATLNPGNSGGPILNQLGQVIGMTIAINANGSGMSFVLPVEVLKPALRQFKRFGRVRKVGLGAKLIALTPRLAERFGLTQTQGVLVTHVSQASVGTRRARGSSFVIDTRGLARGDVIVAIDGVAAASPTRVSCQLAFRDPGSLASVRVIRGDRAFTLDVMLEEELKRLR